MHGVSLLFTPKVRSLLSDFRVFFCCLLNTQIQFVSPYPSRAAVYSDDDDDDDDDDHHHHRHHVQLIILLFGSGCSLRRLY